MGIRFDLNLSSIGSANCSYRIVHNIIFIWQVSLLFFQLSGVALLGLGLLTRYYSTKSEELANRASGDSTGLAALAFIIIGGAVFIVSFFGCCGAIRESHCMITIVSNFHVHTFHTLKYCPCQECHQLLTCQNIFDCVVFLVFSLYPSHSVTFSFLLGFLLPK